jgi:hypothetical protein
MTKTNYSTINLLMKRQKDKFAGYMKKAKFIYEKMKLMQKHSVAKK